MTHSYVDYLMTEDLDIEYDEDIERLLTVEDTDAAIQSVVISLFEETGATIGSQLTGTQIEKLRGRVRDALNDHPFIAAVRRVEVADVSDQTVVLAIDIANDETYHVPLI